MNKQILVLNSLINHFVKHGEGRTEGELSIKVS